MDATARAVALETLELENRAAWVSILDRLAEAGVGPREVYRARTIAWAMRDRMKRPVASAAE
jgi:hypothetical protein